MSDPRVVVVGLRRPGDADTADARLRALVQAMPLIDLVVWAPKAGPALVRTAFRAGAADVLITSSSRVVARAVERVIEAQRVLPRAAQEGDDGRPPVAQQFEGLLSRSPKMHDLFEMVLQVAESDATVLIMGETGTGKELLARAIHRRSQRSTGRFVAVNCGAIQETLIETELFGHEAGAFTGATSPKPGLFRHAEGGTLMLDEVGTLPMNSQYSLLRVLQESTVRPVGGYGETPVDVRVVAATSTPLVDAMAAGSFRDDLFYRLDVIRLDVPPLRERREDIIYLFSLFARQFAEQYSLPRPEVSDDFLDGLVNFDWPGNVRQLQNVSERSILTLAGQKLSLADLDRLVPERRASAPPPSRGEPTARPSIDPKQPMSAALEPLVTEAERRYLDAALTLHRGAIAKTAAHAGIHRRTLLRKMKKYGLDKAHYSRGGEALPSTP